MFHSSSRQWLANSVLSASADAFLTYLQHHQFGPGTIQAYVHCMGHFARWLTEDRVPLASINEVLIERFATEHLPNCKCATRCQRTEVCMRAALAHLLRVLRGNDVIAGPRFGPPPIHDELVRFEAHLESVGGLAPATLR